MARCRLHARAYSDAGLYVRVPFCEIRCGFCNLFTLAGPDSDRVSAYVAQLEQQAYVVLEALGPSTVAGYALGGGTPTFLGVRALERIRETDIPELNLDLIYGIEGPEQSGSLGDLPSGADDTRRVPPSL